MFAEKEVTDDIFDSRTEVLLEEAREIDPNCQLGDLVMVDSTPENFGRIAAQTARQGIQQKIRDAERAAQFEYYGNQVGEIVSGVVQAVNSRQATIGLDLKAEGTMLRKDMIPAERFRVHDRIRAYVYEVKDSPKGLQILLSRAHRNFLRRLLENEVPEIYHGIVEIRSIAREPGQRAKVAVSATQMGIDPVGACVGQRGVRIQAIVRELHDEKIDVIEWSPDAAVYISKAISPARVSGVYLNHGLGDNKTATVVVPEDQLSLAIGREGQNARLAAKLTGWRIDIMSVTEAAGHALVKLRDDETLAEMAAAEADNMARVEELLEKKEEGRAISMDDSILLARFVDRVGKRGEADRKAVEDAEAARIKAVRESIDARAFDLPLAAMSDLTEYLAGILQENGLESFGDLVLTYKLDPDALLAFNGIGPKYNEDLVQLIDSYQFPALEEPEEDAEELLPEAVLDTEEPAAELETAEEILPVEDDAETALAETEDLDQDVKPEPEPELIEEPEEEKTFEELFRMESVRRASYAREQDEEDEAAFSTPSRKGKKASKKKKGYTVEYDPDSDTDIVRRHRRDSDGWDEW